MKSPTFPTLLATACIFFSGCFDESINPLSSPQTSVIDPRLEGDYQLLIKNGEGKKEPSYWHFRYRSDTDPATGKPRPTHWLEILQVNHGEVGSFEIANYRGLATKMGEQNYLSFSFCSKTEPEKEPTNYGFVRYELNKDGDLQVWLMNDTAFRDAVKAGKISGKVGGGDEGPTFKLTDTTENLVKFIAASDPEKLFGGPEELLGKRYLVFRRLAH